MAPGSSSEGPSSESAVARPAPDTTVAARVRAWLAWFGVARLAVTAAGVALVAVAGFWLVRAPAPPAEATLPIAVDAAPATPTAPDDTTPDPTLGDSAGPSVENSAQEPDEIVVHVAGNVTDPGVYVLGPERRVHDAIDAAGGPTEAADTERLNLAQVLHDGQRVFVPAPDDIDAASVPFVTPDLGAAVGDVDTGPIDLNRSDVDELDTLPGVGPSTARAIVDERERNGPFASIDDLERVPGIGPAKLDALRDLVVV